MTRAWSRTREMLDSARNATQMRTFLGQKGQLGPLSSRLACICAGMRTRPGSRTTREAGPLNFRGRRVPSRFYHTAPMISPPAVQSRRSTTVRTCFRCVPRFARIWSWLFRCRMISDRCSHSTEHSGSSVEEQRRFRHLVGLTISQRFPQPDSVP
jgi:hypothetical protein